MIIRFKMKHSSIVSSIVDSNVLEYLKYNQEKNGWTSEDYDIFEAEADLEMELEKFFEWGEYLDLEYDTDEQALKIIKLQ